MSKDHKRVNTGVHHVKMGKLQGPVKLIFAASLLGLGRGRRVYGRRVRGSRGRRRFGGRWVCGGRIGGDRIDGAGRNRIINSRGGGWLSGGRG